MLQRFRFATFCSIIIALASLLVIAQGANADAPAHRPPNIVLIVADDLGINDLGCYGRTDQSTPRLDRLAREGVRFTNAYAAQSVCSPTRAALMTGKTPARLHLTTFLTGRPDARSQLLLHPNIDMQLPLAEVTIAESLRGAGYATACIGKWHLGGAGFLPTDQGFDTYFPGTMNTKPSASEGGKGEYELTSVAERFVEANRERPFFLYLPHNSPHIPLAARPDLIEKHQSAFNPVYAACIESLDDTVGRLLDKLESLALTESTLVIFTSDNGGLHVREAPFSPATHNTPYRAGKGFCYEGGILVPLIVRWPGHASAGREIATPVISTDWTPTLLEAASLKPTTSLDGVSLVGLIEGREPLAPRTLYWHQPHYMNQGSRPSGAIRDGDWKLIEHYEDGRCELFNLAADPSEASDEAARQPARVAELRGKLEKWRRDVGAQRNTVNPSFDQALWRKLYQDVDVSRLTLEPTAAAMSDKLGQWREILNEVVAKSSSQGTAASGGAVLLEARDAKPHGAKLHYEPEPHKDTLGYWVNPDDWAEWTFTPPRPGVYEVELLVGCGAGSGGSEIEVRVGDQAVKMKVEETGHFQRFVPRRIGSLRISRPGEQTLSVHALAKPGAAVMDLRRVALIATE
jgi:arylsulfatase A-like enzyme